MVFLPVFSCKTDSFRRPSAFYWPIGLTAALLGRLLPSDGHKLVNKNGNLGPKVPQIVHFLTSPAILNLYGEQWVLPKGTVITFVCWPQLLWTAQQNSAITPRWTYSEHLTMTDCAGPELQVVFWKSHIQKSGSKYKFLDLKSKPKIRNLGPSGH